MKNSFLEIFDPIDAFEGGNRGQKPSPKKVSTAFKKNSLIGY